MTVAIGKPMPQCAILATSGLTFTPASAKGKKLVLYFYPKDMTPSCTAESGEFRDNIEAFTKANTLVVEVSRDSLKSHDNFRSKLQFPFELVADTVWQTSARCRAQHLSIRFLWQASKRMARP